VLETVTLVLERAGKPMRAREIHAAAEDLVGESLLGTSVKAALAAGVSGPRQRFGNVDEDLERISRARLRLSGGPAARGGIERREPVDPLKPPPMVRADGVADRRSQLTVSAVHERARIINPGR